MVYLEMTGVLEAMGEMSIQRAVTDMFLPELRAIVPDVGERLAMKGAELKSALLDAVRATGRNRAFGISRL